MEQVSGKRAM